MREQLNILNHCLNEWRNNMKIGIITFNSAHNYGAVLQVWALQEKLKSEGHEVEVINYRNPAVDKLYQVFVPKRIFENALLNRGCHKLQYIKAKIKDSSKAKRYKKFEAFIRDVLPSTKPYHTLKALRNAEFDYDIMITGSDQVWNGSLSGGINGAYFLDFGDKNIKRISYAASIGKDEFNEEEKPVVQEYLKDLDYISVREEKAKNAVEELTDKEVDLVLDPTLLLDKEKYDKLKKKFPVKGGDYIFVHNVHLTRVDVRLNAIVEEISARTGLPVVNNRADYTFKNEIGKFSEGGPEEFLGVIDGAKFVITNSFHATVFSIIYEKNFITVPHFKNPDRMVNLLKSFGIENHLISDIKDIPADLNELNVDYAKVNELRKNARIASEKYLQKAINGPKTVPEPVTPDKIYLKSNDKSRCYGCGLCSELSPNAITMEQDEEGMFYPQAVAGQEKCAKETKCLYGNESDAKDIREMYTAHLSDEQALEESFGGGSIRAFAEAIWNQNGVVAGVGYDDTLLPEYRLAESADEAEGFFSKHFVEEKLNGIFEKVSNELSKGRKVLFIGSACKVDALYSYLDKKYDNLYTVQEINEGIISRKVYKKYLESLEKQYGSKVVKVDLYNKTRTAKTPYTCITFESGDIFVCSVRSNILIKALRRGYVTRRSCYSCKYRKEDIIVADIAVKDCSVEDFAYQMGEDLVYILTDSGKELFSISSQSLESSVHAYEGNAMDKIRMTEGRTLLMNKMNDGEDMQEIIRFNLKKRK